MQALCIPACHEPIGATPVLLHEFNFPTVASARPASHAAYKLLCKGSGTCQSLPAYLPAAQPHLASRCDQDLPCLLPIHQWHPRPFLRPKSRRPPCHRSHSPGNPAGQIAPSPTQPLASGPICHSRSFSAQASRVDQGLSQYYDSGEIEHGQQLRGGRDLAPNLQATDLRIVGATAICHEAACQRHFGKQTLVSYGQASPPLRKSSSRESPAGTLSSRRAKVR